MDHFNDGYEMARLITGSANSRITFPTEDVHALEVKSWLDGVLTCFNDQLGLVKAIEVPSTFLSAMQQFEGFDTQQQSYMGHHISEAGNLATAKIEVVSAGPRVIGNG